MAFNKWTIVKEINDKEVDAKCRQCGAVERCSDRSHLARRRCHSCKRQEAITKLNFVLKVRGYMLDKSSYKSARENVKIACQAGHKFEARADNVLRGSVRCAVCTVGYAEQLE